MFIVFWLWCFFLLLADDKGQSKATLTSGLLLGKSEVLRSLRHYLRAQSQGHHSIDRLEERGVERGSARRSSLKDQRGPSSIRRTLEPFQRQCRENFWETGWSACGLFWVYRYHPELDWSELYKSILCSDWRSFQKFLNVIQNLLVSTVSAPSLHLFGIRCLPVCEISPFCPSSKPGSRPSSFHRPFLKPG